MEQRITMISLGSSDVESAANFYVHMGWQLSNKSMDDLKVFDLGGILMALYPKDKLAEDAEVAPEGTGFRAFSLSYNCRSEAEVDALMQMAQSLGATIIKAAQKVFWGGYSGYFADLDGNLLEIAYNPYWQLDDQGRII